MLSRHALLSLLPLLALSSATLTKRDSWGPSLGLGPAAYTILTTSTTLYPGAAPADQAGLLWVWLGISNGTGDLIQSIVGSTPPGQSECGNVPNADNTWCITSEVYGNGPAGTPNQWVGDLKTVDTAFENGIVFNYTLVDRASWTWNQTMRDAKTGALLATFAKASGPMLGWGTAIECNEGCTGTVSEQIYQDSKIVLEQADPNFVNTLGVSQGTTHSDMVTTDGGKTWTIEKINIPAMNAGGAKAVVSGAAAAGAVINTTAAPAVVQSTVTTSATSSTLVTSVVTSSATKSVKSTSSRRGRKHHTKTASP
ncbi:DNA topoisomerase 2 [Sphaceloma murrayae]|uniref:DNA topoisomerase 2 n=1 Tax=Sphaceloma murrayae TaxID=2082308 RepID=A0A2K1R3F4_9PEZI|nr:DNA topoisomerase 2 [Sphaceloma murrayae]